MLNGPSSGERGAEQQEAAARAGTPPPVEEPVGQPAGWPTRELPPAWEPGGLLGPGHLLVMLAPGPAELLLWPWLALLIGPAAAGLLLVAGGLLVLTWLHLARYLIATGASALSGAGRLHPLLLGAGAALGLSQTIWPGQLALAGLAIEYVSGGAVGWQLVTLAGLTLSGLLLGFAPRLFGVLQALAAVLLGLAALVGLGLVPVLVGLLGLDLSAAPPFGAQLVEFGSERPDLLLVATVALGLLSRVGLQPIWHSLYLRDKGAGLASHAPRTASVASGRDESRPWLGARPNLSLPEASERWRGWRRWTLVESLLAGLAPLLPALVLVAAVGLVALSQDPTVLERPTSDVRSQPSLVLAVLASVSPPLAAGLAVLVLVAALGLTASSFDAQSRSQAETLLLAPGLVGRATTPRLYRTSLWLTLALALVALAASWGRPALLLVELLAVVALAGAGLSSLLALALANLLLPPGLRPSRLARVGLLLAGLFWLGWSLAALLEWSTWRAP